MKKLIDNYNQEQLEKIIKESNSFSECCRKIGYSDKGRYGPDVIKEKCKEYSIDYSHFHKKNNNKNNVKYSIEEILIEDSNYKNISSLKSRLIKEKILEYKCDICGNEGEWMGLPLVLQLDHINGNHLDHRIENLRFICPNCHSQTKNFSGKNKNKKTTS